MGPPSLATVAAVHNRSNRTLTIISQAFSPTIRQRRNRQRGTLTTKFSNNRPQPPDQAPPKVKKAAAGAAPTISNPGGKM